MENHSRANAEKKGLRIFKPSTSIGHFHAMSWQWKFFFLWTHEKALERIPLQVVNLPPSSWAYDLTTRWCCVDWWNTGWFEWLRRSSACKLPRLIAADTACHQWTCAITYIWRFGSQSTSLSVCCYTLARETKTAATLSFLFSTECWPWCSDWLKLHPWLADWRCWIVHFYLQCSCSYRV